MNSLKPMLLTSLKSYDRTQFVKRCDRRNHRCDHRTSAVHCTCTGLRCRTGSRNLHGHRCGIRYLRIGRKQCTDCRTDCSICNHRCGYCRQRRTGRARDFNHPCRYLPDPDGPFLSLRKSDQIHSVYDHNRLHIRNRRYDRHRTKLKDFFGVTYPDGVKPIETTEKFKSIY